MKRFAFMVIMTCLAAFRATADEIIFEPSGLGEGFLGPTIEVSLSGFDEYAALPGIGISASYVKENGGSVGVISDWDGHAEGFVWDGVLVGPERESGKLQIFHRSRIELNGRVFNATDPQDFKAFSSYIRNNKLTAINLPLLIDNGRLDLNETANAPKAIRYLAFQMDWGGVGVFRTSQPATLYQAAQSLLNYKMYDIGIVSMAVNLPGGEGTYCLQWKLLDINKCAENKTDIATLYMTLFKYLP